MPRSIKFSFDGPSVKLTVLGVAGPSCHQVLENALSTVSNKIVPGSVTATEDEYRTDETEVQQDHQQAQGNA